MMDFLWIFPRNATGTRMNFRNSLYNAPVKKISNVSKKDASTNFRMDQNGPFWSVLVVRMLKSVRNKAIPEGPDFEKKTTRIWARD